MDLGQRMMSVVAVLMVGLTLTSCGADPDEPEFTEDLVDFSVIDASRVTLDNGTELAIGSDDKHTFVAQWRDEGGSTWTAPIEVSANSDLDASKISIEANADTAVVRLDWYDQNDEDGEEGDEDSRSDALVCHELSCALLEDVSTAPLLDGKGRFAAVSVDKSSYEYALWHAGDDEWQDTENLDGIPAEGRQGNALEVRLLDDGSFVTVAESETDEGCSFELLASEPRGTELEVVASTTPVVQPACLVDMVSADGDKVTFLNVITDQTITFSRDGTEWTDDTAAGGLLSVDPKAGFAMTPTQLDNQSSVAVGSPDLRRIVVQHQPGGQGTWGAPRTVVTAPAGEQCHVARPETIEGHNDVAYLVLCWPNGSAWGNGDGDSDTPAPTSGYVLASTGGKHWTVRRLARPAYELLAPTSEPMLLARGGEQTLVWRPGAKAFQVLNLPLTNPTVDAVLVSRKTAIRVTGNPDDAKPCRPTWSVAPVTARAWGTSSSITPLPDWAKGPISCAAYIVDLEEVGVGSYVGREFRAGVTNDLNRLDGTLKRAGGSWTYIAR